MKRRKGKNEAGYEAGPPVPPPTPQVQLGQDIAGQQIKAKGGKGEMEQDHQVVGHC